MASYLTHLKQMSSSKTFQRKVDYLNFNLGKYLSRNSAILEVGPGLGEFEYYLNQKQIYDIDILDNDKNIIKLISENYKIKKSILIKSSELPVKKLRTYDLILALQVLEHIPVKSYSDFVKILFSKLKKKGTLIIIVPNANNPLGLTERYADLQHTSSFTTQSLNDLVNAADLKNYQLDVKGYQIPPVDLINIVRIFFQKILHTLLIILMAVNGGVYYKVMTPNIMMVLKKK